MALDSPKLSDVLGDISVGKMQLPDFQREWKWDDERIRALLATVTLDYPLGVVMTLETGGAARFKARTLKNSRAAEETTPDLLLLDGQQRLTSLFQALLLNQPVETEDARGKPLKRWYYIDIAKAVDPTADRDDAIVSVPEDRSLKTDFNRRISLDLSSTELECRAKHFPLNIVFDSKLTGAWQKAFVQTDDENWELWTEFADRVLKHVQAFQVPMIRLNADTTKDAVCSVFERVNTGGVPLNVFELLTATYAGDRDYLHQHGVDYSLPDTWADLKKGLATTYPVFGRWDRGVEDGLSSSDFLQAVTLVLTWERKRDGRAAAVACKRRDLLDLPLAEFRRLAPCVAEAFEWVGDFLARQCIIRPEDLPYRTQLVPLAAVRAILGAIDDPALEERLTRWYWCGVLGEMYGGSTESRFTRDVEQLLDWSGAESEAPDTIAEAVFLAERLDSLTTRNSAAYKGIYALLVKQGAVDWYHSEGPLSPALLIEHAVDIRHVFPRPWFARQYGRDGRVDSIVNKTPLSHRASKSVSGSPATYTNALARESGMRPEWFDDVLATHLVDPAALREEDFERFYEARSGQLSELVKEAMGKKTVQRDPQGG